MIPDHNEYMKAHNRHVQRHDDAEQGNRNEAANETNIYEENRISYYLIRQA